MIAVYMLKNAKKNPLNVINFLALSKKRDKKNLHDLNMLLDGTTHPLLVAFGALAQTPNRNASCFF